MDPYYLSAYGPRFFGLGFLEIIVLAAIVIVLVGAIFKRLKGGNASTPDPWGDNSSGSDAPSAKKDPWE